MSIINKYNDPLIFNWERDSKGNRISVPIVGEEHYIEDGKIVLEGLPDVEYGVNIKNYHEVFSKDLVRDYTFFVDYKNTGIIYFDPKRGGTVRVSYYSRGMNYYPASRVWTKVNRDGSVQETLDETLKNIKEIDKYLEEFKKDIIRNREELELSIEEANNIVKEIEELEETIVKDLNRKLTNINKELEDLEGGILWLDILVGNLQNEVRRQTQELNEAIEEFETSLAEIEGKADETLDLVEQRIEEIGDLEDLAEVTINQLEGAIKTADYTRERVVEADFKAFNTMNELNRRITYAEEVMEELKGITEETLKLIDNLNVKISEIEELLNKMNTTIDEAIEKEQKLKDIISKGEETEQSIINTINKGKETKNDLDVSIEEGKDLLNDLEGIIELDEEEVLEIIEKNVNDIKVYETSQEASEKAKVGQIYFIKGNTEPRIKTSDNTSTGLATEQSVLVALSTIENLTKRVDEWSDQVNVNAKTTNENFNKMFDSLEEVLQ